MRLPAQLSLIVTLLAGAIVGCHHLDEAIQNETAQDASCSDGAGCDSEGSVEQVAYHCEATSVAVPTLECEEDQYSALVEQYRPRTLDSETPAEYFDLSLEEAIRMALSNNTVLESLDAKILSTPESLTTIWNPAITEANPVFGVEGALSAFDAQLATRMFWSRNDRVFNNITAGQGVRQFTQDTSNFEADLSKTTAVGSTFALRNRTDYEWNNAVGNRFPSSYTTVMEAEARQPLMQGFGAEFNRIAGPNNQPGFFFSNGLLLARTETDKSIADFEAQVIQFVSDVEDAYWELYFAYRELDARMTTRRAALESWQFIHARFVEGVPGGEAEKENQARDQFYLYDELVDEALNGSAVGGGPIGVYNGERKLRTLLGIPESELRMLRPGDEPPEASVEFSWEDSLAEAMSRRVELRRQKWQIKRRELELKAAENFTKPRLDVVGRYRWRGFGDDLISDSTGPRFDNAVSDLYNGDFQEWDLGVEYSVPLGFRQAHAGVSHAELQLTRERAVLHEQERRIAQGLATAIAEVHRVRAVMAKRYNRLTAAAQRLESTQAAFDAGQSSPEALLQANEGLASAQSGYYRSRVDYGLALKRVQSEKGSLLDYNNVWLSEGPWPGKAYQDAHQLVASWRAWNTNQVVTQPAALSHPEWATESGPPLPDTEGEMLEQPAPIPEEVNRLPEGTPVPQRTTHILRAPNSPVPQPEIRRVGLQTARSSSVERTAQHVERAAFEARAAQLRRQSMTR